MRDMHAPARRNGESSSRVPCLTSADTHETWRHSGIQNAPIVGGPGSRVVRLSPNADSSPSVYYLRGVRTEVRIAAPAAHTSPSRVVTVRSVARATAKPQHPGSTVAATVPGLGPVASQNEAVGTCRVQPSAAARSTAFVSRVR